MPRDDVLQFLVFQHGAHNGVLLVQEGVVGNKGSRLVFQLGLLEDHSGKAVQEESYHLVWI